MSVKLQMNLTLLLQTSGVNWQVKFEMLQLRIQHEQIRFYHGNKTTLDAFFSLKIKVPVMVTAVSVFLENVLTVYLNL